MLSTKDRDSIGQLTARIRERGLTPENRELLRGLHGQITDNDTTDTNKEDSEQ